MKIETNSNNITLSHKEEFKDKIDFLYAAVNAYSGLTLDRSVWLTDRETMFFIAIVIFIKGGAKKCTDPSAIKMIEDVFGKHSRQLRVGYTKKLADKNWIKMDKETKHITIPQFFQEIDLEETASINFSISFSYCH